MKATILRLAMLLFLFNILHVEVSAQKNPVKKELKEKDKDKDKGKDKDKDKNKKSIPIDGGIGLLLAAGVGLGARKFINKNKEHN